MNIDTTEPPKRAALSGNDYPHIRFNPLKGEWILVSPNRMRRPWLGQVENYIDDVIREFDPENPLCPGVRRGNGEVTPDYSSTYVFNNDYPAMLEKLPVIMESDDPLFKCKPAIGVCKVMCLHPKSNMTMSLLSQKEIVNIINKWVELTEHLGKKYIWVQIFENKGTIMGCSNPHPHCQIWASSFLPNEPKIKDICQFEYYKKHGKPLLLDYVERECEKKERLVMENDDWAVIVPYWALWPFETIVLPKTHIKRFTDLKPDNPKIATLAQILRRLTQTYDSLFKCTFPYTMGWHGAPTGRRYLEESTHWVFHGMYYPPLFRSATIKKFMVGYEMLAQGQRDLTPEAAASKLRATYEQLLNLEM